MLAEIDALGKWPCNRHGSRVDDKTQVEHDEMDVVLPLCLGKAGQMAIGPAKEVKVGDHAVVEGDKYRFREVGDTIIIHKRAIAEVGDLGGCENRIPGIGYRRCK
jgi:hypothetical protein